MPFTIGRPRTRGERLPSPAGTTTRWQRVIVPGGHGEGDRVLELCPHTAAWRRSGMPGITVDGIIGP